MCEIPANAILAEQFLDKCDGFSIGSNDLLQLTLGVDRDNQLLTAYDERNPAVRLGDRSVLAHTGTPETTIIEVGCRKSCVYLPLYSKLISVSFSGSKKPNVLNIHRRNKNGVPIEKVVAQ